MGEKVAKKKSKSSSSSAPAPPPPPPQLHQQQQNVSQMNAPPPHLHMNNSNSNHAEATLATMMQHNHGGEEKASKKPLSSSSVVPLKSSFLSSKSSTGHSAPATTGASPSSHLHPTSSSKRAQKYSSSASELRKELLSGAVPSQPPPPLHKSAASSVVSKMHKNNNASASSSIVPSKFEAKSKSNSASPGSDDDDDQAHYHAMKKTKAAMPHHSKEKIMKSKKEAPSRPAFSSSVESEAVKMHHPTKSKKEEESAAMMPMMMTKSKKGGKGSAAPQQATEVEEEDEPLFDELKEEEEEEAPEQQQQEEAPNAFFVEQKEANEAENADFLNDNNVADYDDDELFEELGSYASSSSSSANRAKGGASTNKQKQQKMMPFKQLPPRNNNTNKEIGINKPQQEALFQPPQQTEIDISSASSSSLWLTQLAKKHGTELPTNHVTTLIDNGIDEESFLLLTEKELSELSLPLGSRLKILKLIQAEKLKQIQDNRSANAQSLDEESQKLMSLLASKFHPNLVIMPNDLDLHHETSLGRGGYGSVCAASLGGRPVAAKLFDDIANGLEECERGIGLYHRNIVNVIGVSVCPTRRAAATKNQTAEGGGSGESGGGGGGTQKTKTAICLAPKPRLVMVMDLAEGSLYAILAAAGTTLNFDVVMRYGLQIASGLQYLHTHSPMIIHSDVKPNNCLLYHDATIIRLTDFGISRETDRTRTNVTNAGHGTPLYMAPEAFLGTVVAPTNDTYGWGAIMYWMISKSGEPYGGSLREFMAASTSASSTPASSSLVVEPLVSFLTDDNIRPGCPEFLAQLVRRCLAVDPKERPRDGDELFKILAEGCASVAPALVVGMAQMVSSSSSGSTAAAAAPMDQLSGGGEGGSYWYSNNPNVTETFSYDEMLTK